MQRRSLSRVVSLWYLKDMKTALLFILTLVSQTLFAVNFDQCQFLFPKNTPPRVSASDTQDLCFKSYATLYSRKSKTAVFSVEKLNYIALKGRTPRKNHFHEEMRLRPSDRSTLKDYARSGYDRGHLAPAADFSDPLANEESFSLANMVPQAKANNRGIWAKSVEKPTRQYIEKRAKGNVYVFTGPYFENGHKAIGSNRVWVPDFIWKLVYDEAANRAWVFWVKNTDDARMSTPISYTEFVKRTGLKLLGDINPST